ncbi:hypothetical protein PSP31121_04941 [Pandoraea sputorum]|uniref:Uncharacterized protein n=1 Tax=Pandoraea sputorum TaxID=93222 RepID=A0A5E5BGF5_9BURK|nr:hypothetical protein PSP31121_04941 [Pandoraea sputorum]
MFQSKEEIAPVDCGARFVMQSYGSRAIGLKWNPFAYIGCLKERISHWADKPEGAANTTATICD